MEVSIRKINGWAEVLNASRFTVHKDAVDKEPSEKFKHNIIYAEHSPLRELRFEVIIKDIPYFSVMHLVRHWNGLEKYVATSREDRTGVSRDERKQTDLVDFMFTINAQALINISKVRLCACADATTRQTWTLVVHKLAEIEPLLAHACVPTCVYRGFCPEIQCCGYVNTPAYTKARASYVKA